MNFSVSNNRLKLSNGYDVSGSINTTSLLVGTNVGINPTYVLDVSSNNVNTVKLNNIFYVDGSNNRVSIGTNFSNASYSFDVSGETRIQTTNVRIGRNAGDISQGINAIAIGTQAGQTNQGSNSIAIGNFAGRSNLPNNTIHLNATSSALSTVTQQNALYINPIRDDINPVPNYYPLFYQFDNKEVFINSTVSIFGYNSGDNLESMYGDGSDTAISFDGTISYNSIFSTFNSATNTYTLTRDIYPSDMYVAGGYTLITAGFRIFCYNSINNEGLIHNNGGNASGTTFGTGGSGGFFRAGGNGATGLLAASVGAIGTAPTAPTAGTWVGNNGGRGGPGRTTNTNFIGVSIPSSYNTNFPSVSVGGRKITSSTSGFIFTNQTGSGAFFQITPSIGGCSGSKSTTGTAATSGGGGGGGGMMMIAAPFMIGTGFYQCLGGNGGDGAGTGGNFGGGGGGSGGIIGVYTRKQTWDSVNPYFSVAGGSGGTSVGLVASNNFPIAFAGSSANTGLLTGSSEYLLSFSPSTRVSNINSLYLLSIFTTTSSGDRAEVTSVNGYSGSVYNTNWTKLDDYTVEIGTQSRLELWYSYMTTNTVGPDMNNEVNVRVTFGVPPTSYRAMLDEINNTSLTDGINPITFNTDPPIPNNVITASVSSATTISATFPNALTVGNLVYTVVARSGGTAPVAGGGAALLNTQTVAPVMASQISTNAVQPSQSWTTAANAGLISIEIAQGSIAEPGSPGCPGRIIKFGGSN